MIAGMLERARLTWLNRALTVFAAVVLAAGLVLVWVRVVQTLTESSHGPRTVGQPGALVWDGRVFSTSAQMKAYLTSRGLSYSRWAARHPTAFGATPTAVTHTTTSKPAQHRVASPSVSPTSTRSGTSMLLLVMFLVGGLILGGSALLPARYAPDVIQRFYDHQDRRMVALAAATAILLGFGVAFYLMG
jgi:hypothetical protein